MSALSTGSWGETNQRHLTAALARVRAALEQAADPEAPRVDPSAEPANASSPGRPAALESLCSGLGLSPFERDVLLLCAGVELDARFAPLCAAAQGNPALDYPTFGLALRALPQAHWTALVPTAPLRHWRLIEIDPGPTLTASRLHIDERALHHLTGVTYLDSRLRALVEPVTLPAWLPASYRVQAERVARLWSDDEGERPVIRLEGDARAGKRMLAAAGCSALGLRLHGLRAADVPAAPAERETLLRLWEREALFSGSALLLECTEDDEPANLRAAGAFAERLQGLLLVTGPLPVLRRPAANVEVNRPAADEQLALWRRALGPLAGGLNGQLDAVADQLPLDVEDIQAAGKAVWAGVEGTPPAALAPLLWEACRARARPPLQELAQRLRPSSGWDDLVLPDEQTQTLRALAAQVRQRTRVYRDWGFAARGGGGLGISALFTGPSGTGKTLAAEVLAGELRLDLYRIDLSQVVDKYLGETEKRLRRVFDAAEQGGAVLLFDEADALFGKRSEVKDSHDRYANIEVSYLLQRMEAYSGLAILTTNQRAALDPAFLRRLRFVVSFPFPDAAQRSRIWQRIFPPGTPTAGLDFDKLARLNVSGGNIRNIALGAAFLAADAGEPVRMTHLLQAARSECAKLEKAMTASEIGGWL
jgi:hypothetical protein